MEKQQTAVEWLYDQIENKGKSIYEIIEQAKQMEKNQIKNAYKTRYIKRFDSLNAEQYYNKNFKSE